MQTQLNGMTGQLEQILLALQSPAVATPRINDDVDDVADSDPSIDSDKSDDDADTYDRYYRDEYETVTSVQTTTPKSYENSAIVLSRGDICLWKSRSCLYFHVTVIATTFHQASSNLHYKVMLASEGTYVENVKHSDLFLDPASKPKSTGDSLPLSSGTTHFPPLRGVQAVRRVAARPITFQYGDVTLTTSPTICHVGDTIYWRHHSNLIQQAQIMRAVMPCNPDEPIVYDIMGLNNATARFYNVPHHEIYLDATTPTYDPSTLAPDEAPLTAIQRLQLAAHPGHSSQDIHRWGDMKASKFKWLYFNRAMKDIYLENDTTVAIERMYAKLQLNIESCHDSAIALLPDLSTLRPSDTFAARMLPPTTYNNYHEAQAFFKKLANHIRSLLEEPKFTARAPNARQGLQFIKSSDAHGLDMLFCMLTHTMPHLGALGFNPQKLIDALVLMNGDNVYDFMGKALEVEKSIRISHMTPSPDALISQIITEISKSQDHHQAISEIKSSFILHVRQFTLNVQYTKHDAVAVQYLLMAMDAPFLAVIAGIAPITPSSTRNLLSDPVSIRQKLLPSTANEDDDEDSRDGLTQAHMSLQMRSDEEVDPDVRSLRPSRSSTPRDGFKSSQRRTGNGTRIICGFCEEPGHHRDGCIKRGPPFWPDWHAKKVEQFNAKHGSRPEQKSDAAPPPPPKARFQPNLRTLQTTVEQVVGELEQQLEDNNAEGEALMCKAIAVRHVQSDDANQVIVQDQFDAQSDSGSVYALGSDTSSDLAYDDLELYDQPVNY